MREQPDQVSLWSAIASINWHALCSITEVETGIEGENRMSELGKWNLQTLDLYGAAL